MEKLATKLSHGVIGIESTSPHNDVRLQITLKRNTDTSGNAFSTATLDSWFITDNFNSLDNHRELFQNNNEERVDVAGPDNTSSFLFYDEIFNTSGVVILGNVFGDARELYLTGVYYARYGFNQPGNAFSASGVFILFQQ